MFMALDGNGDGCARLFGAASDYIHIYVYIYIYV